MSLYWSLNNIIYYKILFYLSTFFFICFYLLTLSYFIFICKFKFTSFKINLYSSPTQNNYVQNPNMVISEHFFQILQKKKLFNEL